MSPIFNVAVLLYKDADIIDFAGPTEIYTNRPATGERPFKTTTFSLDNPVSVGHGVLTLIPDASFQDVQANLNNFDILMVPGGMPDQILEMLKREEGKAITKLLNDFASLPPRKETGHRIIQSVCTGALVLAASGILKGRTVTTHHMAYDLMKQMADEAAGGESNTNVISKRWVDAGLTDAGVRIVNAGGVTSGIDTSLHITEMLVGKEAADWAAEVSEFEKRGQDEAWGSA
ncbi:transcriptional regulator [Sporormia fimetaria CBS 119925]|uniref:Transcriptional regulator n=1 Tax=Sporormia fimetaria CBS 119925 TaxID=1340428 RepID=A0A6A6VGL0_9PLEO|nr:transcriptional regulator [Sporormia fimetaria CBS 119925]